MPLSAFAQYLKDHKGSGKNIKQLAVDYKRQLQQSKEKGLPRASGYKMSVLAAFYYIGWPAGVDQNTEEASYMPVTTEAAAKKLKNDLNGIYTKIQKRTPDLLKWTVTKTKYRGSDKSIIFNVTYATKTPDALDPEEMVNHVYAAVTEFYDIQGRVYILQKGENGKTQAVEKSNNKWDSPGYYQFHD